MQERIALAGTDQEGNMTAIAYRIASSNTFSRLAGYIGLFMEGAREGRQIAARYNELSQLSGADLASRGLNRQTISRAALTCH